MDGEVEHPERQAENALREAIRKLESGMCPKCGRTDPHGDEDHWSVNLHTRPSYPQCSNGPDCQCPFHFGLERVRVCCPVCGLTGDHGDRTHQYRYSNGHYELTPGPDPEAELRRRRREIADEQARHGFPMAELRPCTRCGMDDEPVKGPPGAELCKWCDQLRILAPPPAWKSGEPVIERPSFRHFLAEHIASRSFAISCALLMTGSLLMLTGSGYFFLGAALWLAGFFWPTKRR